MATKKQKAAALGIPGSPTGIAPRYCARKKTLHRIRVKASKKAARKRRRKHR
jgi:hypothetical protein